MSEPVPGIYPLLVIEHARRPRNRRVPAVVTHSAGGDNPLCGDQLHVHLRVDAGRIRDIAFDGVCCAVATASASLMTEALMGRELTQARHIRDAFLALMAGGIPRAADLDDLGELGTLAEIRAMRAREPCMLLAWEALAGALRLGPLAAPGSALPASVRQ
jgi:nitrogen fixation NifU-like protein